MSSVVGPQLSQDHLVSECSMLRVALTASDPIETPQPSGRPGQSEWGWE